MIAYKPYFSEITQMQWKYIFKNFWGKYLKYLL